MKGTLRYGIILGLICSVAAGLLAGVNYLTKQKIYAQAQAEEDASLKEVLAGANKFEAVKSGKDIIYYKGFDAKGRLLGVVFKCSQKGYSSAIETITGMLQDGTLTAIKILSQNETPGLGARISEPEFTGRFANISVSNIANVEAITGATISSRAVIDSVKQRAEEIKQLIKDEK